MLSHTEASNTLLPKPVQKYYKKTKKITRKQRKQIKQNYKKKTKKQKQNRPVSLRKTDVHISNKILTNWTQ